MSDDEDKEYFSNYSKEELDSLVEWDGPLMITTDETRRAEFHRSIKQNLKKMVKEDTIK